MFFGARGPRGWGGGGGRGPGGCGGGGQGMDGRKNHPPAGRGVVCVHGVRPGEDGAAGGGRGPLRLLGGTVRPHGRAAGDDRGCGVPRIPVFGVGVPLRGEGRESVRLLGEGRGFVPACDGSGTGARVRPGQEIFHLTGNPEGNFTGGDAMIVAKRMMRNPVFVDENDSMKKAMDILKEREIRHLPVLKGGDKLVGILTERDIKQASPSSATALEIREIFYLLDKGQAKQIMTRGGV